MKQIPQSVIATGALALVLATPAAPLQAAPGSLGRAGPAGATEDLTGLKATVVRDRWRPRHDRWRGRHGQPQRWRHRHRPYPHRATPYWSFTYPFPCIVAKPWPRGTGATTAIAITGDIAIRFPGTDMSAAMAGSPSCCRCLIRGRTPGSGTAASAVARGRPGAPPQFCFPARFLARARRASRLRVSTPNAKAMAKYR